VFRAINVIVFKSLVSVLCTVVCFSEWERLTMQEMCILKRSKLGGLWISVV